MGHFLHALGGHASAAQHVGEKRPYVVGTLWSAERDQQDSIKHQPIVSAISQFANRKSSTTNSRVSRSVLRPRRTASACSSATHHRVAAAAGLKTQAGSCEWPLRLP